MIFTIKIPTRCITAILKNEVNQGNEERFMKEKCIKSLENY